MCTVYKHVHTISVFRVLRVMFAYYVDASLRPSAKTISASPDALFVICGHRVTRNHKYFVNVPIRIRLPMVFNIRNVVQLLNSHDVMDICIRWTHSHTVILNYRLSLPIIVCKERYILLYLQHSLHRVLYTLDAYAFVINSEFLVLDRQTYMYRKRWVFVFMKHEW